MLFLLVLAVRVQAGSAASGLITGVTDDGFRWRTQEATTFARLLGLSAFRVSLPWEPGQVDLTAADARQFDTMVPATFGLRTVVTVYGSAQSAPIDAAGRTAYCTYVRNLLERYPTIDDVVIWNEANLGFFWQPQFDPNGASAAPAAYGRLLAQCWDGLHSLRPSVNLVTSTSPSGNDNPNAVATSPTHPARFCASWARRIALAGGANPSSTPWATNPYGMSSAEVPLAKAPDADSHLAGRHRQARAGAHRRLPRYSPANAGGLWRSRFVREDLVPGGGLSDAAGCRPPFSVHGP